MDSYVLLDIRGLALRSLHSGTDAEGDRDSLTGKIVNTPGHALYNLTTSVLQPILKDFRVGQIIAVWDGGNRYREQLFPEYKAARKAREQSPEMQHAISETIKNTKLMLKYLGVTQVVVDTVEADDVIAWMAQQLPASVIYTVDRDLCQLGSETVLVNIGHEFVDCFKDKDVEVPFHRVALYKSLVGDTSDGYKGVKGFGPAKWLKLVEEYGDDGLQQLEDMHPGKGYKLLKELAPTEPLLAMIDSDLQGWIRCWDLARLHPELVNMKLSEGGKARFLTPKWSKAVPNVQKLGPFLDSVNAPELREALGPYMPNPPFILDASALEDEAGTLEQARELFAESPFISIDWETSAPVNENFKEAAKGREVVDMLSSAITGAGFTFGRDLQHTFYATFDHAGNNNLPASFLPKLIDCIPQGTPLVIQNCLLGDVEVLTPKGWKRIDEANTSDQIMQWDPSDGTLSFTHPKGKVEQKASSMLTWSSSFHDCSYTSEHRMYLKRHGADWKVLTADEAATVHPNSMYLPVSGTYLPPSDEAIDLSFDEARFMEAVRADGHFPKVGRQVKFRFSKQRKVERLTALLNGLGVTYSVTTYTTEAKPVTGITLEGCPLTDKVKDLLGPGKEYGQWVLNLSNTAKNAILDEIRHWDGDRHPKSHSNRVSTVSQRTVDALQLMAHTVGRRFSVSWTDNKRGSENAQPLANVCIAPKDKSKLSAWPVKVEGAFDVYCFSVPTGAFMVRSNGKVHITGNCYFEQTIYKNQFGLDLPEAHDTKVMGNHLDEQESSGLKDMSLRLLGYKQLHYKDVIEPGKAMRDYPAEHVLKYGADDPLVTAHLYDLLKLQLLLEGTWEFVKQNEFPPIRLLSDAYLAGVNVDWEELERVRIEDQAIFDTNMARLRQLIKEHQTPELLRAGVENLLKIEREIIDAKYAAKVKSKELSEDEAKEKVADAIASLHLRLQDLVEYRDQVKVEQLIDFSLTAAQFNKVADHLGLPRLESHTNKAWKAWLAEAMQGNYTGQTEILIDCVKQGIKDVHHARWLEHLEAKRFMRICKEATVELTPEDKRYKLEGSELSLSSPVQMRALLYGMLNLPVHITSFNVSEEREALGLEGTVQANEDAIVTAMAKDAPEDSWKREALECLLAAKKADTRRKNFYTTYPLWRHPKSGLVHPQLNSVGTETRRMSGSSPNLMQLPKRGEGIKFRHCILPLPGHDLVCSIDWAGEELRVGAGLSRDIEMLSCFIDADVLKTLPQWMVSQLGSEYVDRFRGAELRDIHSLTAAGIVGVPYEQFEAVRRDEDHKDHKRYKKVRGEAKAVNFGSAYGIGPAKLARQLICEEDAAREYLSAKKKLYSGYEEWREQAIQDLKSQGFLATLYGSRRHLFDKILTPDDGLRGAYERAAVNFLIQGLCADVLKVTLTELYQLKTFERHHAQLIAPVHDEVVFSCHSSQAPSLIMEVHSIMTKGIPGLPCPLWAEPSLGPNFGQQTEIGPHPTPELINRAISKALNLKEAA